MKQIISKDKLLESGLQYGHKTESWNPAMKPFIATVRRSIHMVNLDKTSMSLDNAYNVVKKISEKRGTFLFVGTTKQSSKTVRENAERVGAFYIDHRWLGGLLTNFRTIQNSVNKLRNLERLEKTNFEGYTKKEAVLMKKKLIKLERTLGGIKHMRRVPQAIFVTSIRNEDIAIKEARKMKIPVFGIADTNVNPYAVNFPIFGNDDANKATSLVTTIIADAIAAAKNEEQYVAYVEDDKIRIIGLEDKKEFIPREDKFRRSPRPYVKTFEKKEPIVEKKEEIIKVVKEPIVEKKEEIIKIVKEPVVEVKKVENKPSQKEIDDLKKAIDAEAKKVLDEIKSSKINKKEIMRENILSKLEENNETNSDDIFKGIELIEIFGVGPKCEQYLNKNGQFTILDVSLLKIEELSDEFIKNLPNLRSATFEINKEKIINIIKEAKYIIKEHESRIKEISVNTKTEDQKVKVAKKAYDKTKEIEEKEKQSQKEIEANELKAKESQIEKEKQSQKEIEALEEAKRVHALKELEKKENFRKELLLKLKENENISDIEIIEIYGVGVKIGEYLVSHNLTTVGEVAEVDVEKIPLDIIENLPNLKSATTEDNKEKIVNIIKEAKIVLSLYKNHNEETKIINELVEHKDISKVDEKQEKMRKNILSKLSKNHDLSEIELIEIFGIGKKVGEYFVENDFITINDVASIKFKDLNEEFINDFPTLKSATLKNKQDKIKNIIKEAKFIFKKHKENEEEKNRISTMEFKIIAEAGEANKQKNTQAKIEEKAIGDIEKNKEKIANMSKEKELQSKKEADALEEAMRIHKEKELEKKEKIRKALLTRLKNNENVADIKLIEIYGVGIKVGEYLVNHGLVKIGDVAKLNVDEIPSDIIKNFPCLKSATENDNKEKIKHIIEEANFLIENYKEKK